MLSSYNYSHSAHLFHNRRAVDRRIGAEGKQLGGGPQAGLQAHQVQHQAAVHCAAPARCLHDGLAGKVC